MRPRNKLKTYLHYHHAYGHKTYQGGDESAKLVVVFRAAWRTYQPKSEKNKKNSPRKKFLIFQEMELSSSNIKKILIFPEMKPYTFQPQTSKFLPKKISCIFSEKTCSEKDLFYFPKNAPNFQETETSKKISYA